jgi:hypothetical protein
MLLVLWLLNPASFGSLVSLAARSRASEAACARPAIALAATRALTGAQLATHLVDEARGDYRPATLASIFHGGQPAYFSFEIATNAAGMASVLFCTPGGSIRGALSVPVGSGNRYGQFSAVFDADDAGQGTAILKWNGQVAAAVPFTVER